VSAAKLIAAGLVNLSEMNAKVAAGGRWYAALPGVGRSKGARLAAHLRTLLPPEVLPKKTQFALTTTHGLFAIEAARAVDLPLSSRNSPALLSASNDQEAVDAWIAAHAGSELTATA
jgi:hypothetical protein